jgi:ABC-type transport system involved in cytochrome c biogenesis permease component
MKRIFSDTKAWIKKNKLPLARWLWLFLFIIVVFDVFWYLFVCPQNSTKHFIAGLLLSLCLLDVIVGLMSFAMGKKKHGFFLGVVSVQVEDNWEDIKIF